MAALKLAGWVAGGLVCLAIGPLMIVDGETPIGVAMIAFGVMCFLAPWLLREPSAPEEPVRIGEVAASGRSFRGLVLTFSQRRAVLGLLIGICFTIAGVGIALDGAVLLGVACAALFGFMSVLGVVNVVNGAGELVFTPEELAHVSRLGRASIRWDAVEEVGWFSIRGTEFIRLSGPVERDAGLGALLARLGRRRGLEFAPLAVGVNTDWLDEVIGRCVEDPDERARVAEGRVSLPGGADTPLAAGTA